MGLSTQHKEKKKHTILSQYKSVKTNLVTDASTQATNTDHENSAIIPVKLEQMVKKFKTHRCALDFDYSFCKEVFNDENAQ